MIRHNSRSFVFFISLVAFSLSLSAADIEKISPTKKEIAEKFLNASSFLDIIKITLYTKQKENQWVINWHINDRQVITYPVDQSPLKNDIDIINKEPLPNDIFPINTTKSVTEQQFPKEELDRLCKDLIKFAFYKEPLPKDTSPVIDYYAIKAAWVDKLISKYNENTLEKLIDIHRNKSNRPNKTEQQLLKELDSLYEDFIKNDVIHLGIILKWQFVTLLPDLLERQTLAKELISSKKITKFFTNIAKTNKNAKDFYIKIRGIDQNIKLEIPSTIKNQDASPEFDTKKFIAKIIDYFAERPVETLQKLLKVPVALDLDVEKSSEDQKSSVKLFNKIASDFVSYRVLHYINDYIQWYILKE